MLQIYSHSNFQAFGTQLTTVIMLSMRPPELPYLLTESLYPVTDIFNSSRYFAPPDLTYSLFYNYTHTRGPPEHLAT